MFGDKRKIFCSCRLNSKAITKQKEVQEYWEQYQIIKTRKAKAIALGAAAAATTIVAAAINANNKAI